MKSFIKENKEYLIFYLGVLLAGFLYLLFGHRIIESATASTNFGDMSPDQYLMLIDKIVFLILAVLSVCFLLHRLVYSAKNMHLIWPLVIFASIFALTFKLNPNLRVYSAHGFLHAGIVYQILNGQVPPANPLLAGEPLLYPWGYEFIIAGITYIFKITPFMSFAILNVTLLVVAMLLIYRISRFLFKDTNANVLATIISFLGVTIFSENLVALLHNINIPSESRGIPASTKFFTFNAIPMGLVCFLIFLYSVIKIFIDQKSKASVILFMVSVLLCGFTYPQFMPGIIAATISVCLVTVVWNRKANIGLYVRKSILIISLLIISTLILLPYILSISTGMKGSVEIFKVKFILLNMVSYFVVCLPILVVIFLNIKFLWRNLDKRVLVIIFAVVAATFCCYVSLHMPLNNEYKSLILSLTTIGILGGISFVGMKQWCNRGVIFILVLLLMYPLFDRIYSRMRYLEYLPVEYLEKGKFIYSQNLEKNELYDWIRNKTNVNDVFIDKDNCLPVFAQRQLFITVDKTQTVKTKTGRFQFTNPGYIFSMETFFQVIFGYDRKLIKNRINIAKTIYSLDRDLMPEKRKRLCDKHSNIYVIIRNASFRKIFKQKGYDRVFQSSQGNFIVYLYQNKPKPESLEVPQ